MPIVGSTKKAKLTLTETLVDNLSGKQTYNLLTHFLDLAVSPIFDYSEYGKVRMIEIYMFFLKDRRRRITYLSDTDEFVEHLYNCLLSDTPSKFWRRSHLERRYCMMIAEGFLQHFPRNMSRHKSGVGPYNVDYRHLAPMLQHVRAALDLYVNFKNMLIDKYTKYAQRISARSAQATGLNVDAQDLYDDFVVAIDNAINKFDPNKGTLTSVIKYWFLNAETEGGHVYGESYTINSRERRRLQKNLASGVSAESNFAAPIEDAAEIPIEETLALEEPNDDMINFAKRSRGGKLFLLLHGVNYKLSPEEKRTFDAM